MKKYINQLRQYISENPIRFDRDCDAPALDALYWHYSECHNMSNDNTRAGWQALDDHFSALSFDEHNRVFIVVGSLCAEYERIAFLSGLRLGAQLMMELYRDTEIP